LKIDNDMRALCLQLSNDYISRHTANKSIGLLQRDNYNKQVGQNDRYFQKNISVWPDISQNANYSCQHFRLKVKFLFADHVFNSHLDHALEKIRI